MTSPSADRERPPEGRQEAFVKPILFSMISAFSFCGCTTGRLMVNTVQQAGTLADIQHQQVLNNLAAFATNPYAMPSQVNLRDGSAQITDNGSILGQVIHDRFLALGAQRTVNDQWSLTPVTEDTTLKLLRVAYRRAFGSAEDLYGNDLANDLAHELKKQTTTVDDLRTVNQESGPENLSAESTSEGRVKLGFDENQKQRWVNNFESYVSTLSPKIIQDGEYLRDDNLSFTKIPDDQIEAGKGPRYKRVTPLAIEIRRQVMEVNNDLLKINPGWLGVGCSRKDIPKDACFVARHDGCDGVTYVWVCPSGRAAFEEFTLDILNFSSLLKESQVIGISGPRYSPGYAFSPGRP